MRTKRQASLCAPAHTRFGNDTTGNPLLVQNHKKSNVGVSCTIVDKQIAE